jgi:hypothetical protein
LVVAFNVQVLPAGACKSDEGYVGNALCVFGGAGLWHCSRQTGMRK